MITTRLLPPDEWDRLAALPPFCDSGLPNPAHWRVIVAEDTTGDIVGHCCLFDAVHWEGWHVAPEARGNPALIRGLIREGVEVLRDADVGGVFAMIDADQIGATRAMIERFGFTAAPGDLYLAAVDDLVGG